MVRSLQSFAPELADLARYELSERGMCSSMLLGNLDDDDFVLLRRCLPGPHVERATSCGDGAENRLLTTGTRYSDGDVGCLVSASKSSIMRRGLLKIAGFLEYFLPADRPGAMSA